MASALKYIVIDGVGKSTKALKLCQKLKSQGKTVSIHTKPIDDWKNYFGVNLRGNMYADINAVQSPWLVRFQWKAIKLSCHEHGSTRYEDSKHRSH